MVKIICEGKTDKKFIQILLKHLELPSNDSIFEIMRGKSSLLNVDNDKYNKLKQVFENRGVDKVLFITDSDDEKNDKTSGYENTKENLNELIDNLNWINNSDYYINCNPKTKDGYLESLILSTIPKNERVCIDNFLNCSRFKSKNNAKSIINQIYNLGYPNAPYNFSHENFNELKSKLKELFS